MHAGCHDTVYLRHTFLLSKQEPLLKGKSLLTSSCADVVDHSYEPSAWYWYQPSPCLPPALEYKCAGQLKKGF